MKVGFDRLDWKRVEIRIRRVEEEAVVIIRIEVIKE